MSGEKRSEGWLAKWREQRRAKRARTGDTPEKVAERRHTKDDPSVTDAMARAGEAGFIAGG
jgi:hypothetical protein